MTKRTGRKNFANSAFHWSAQLDSTTTIEKRLAVGIALTIAIIAGSVLSYISFIDSWCFGTQKSWCLALY
jgi:hypothetical protein